MAQEVGHFHARNRDRILKGQKQAEPGPLVRIEGQQIGAVDFDFAAGDLVFRVPRQSVRERALARAVGSHQGVDFARADLQIDPVENWQILDRDVQIRNSQRLSHDARLDSPTFPSSHVLYLQSTRLQSAEAGPRKIVQTSTRSETAA